jgi:hypothetical protein
MAAGTIEVRLGARLLSIAPHSATIEDATGSHTIANDAVIVCAGGTLPREWLHHLGIAVETRHGEPG